MVLAKPWYHTAIICAKKQQQPTFNTNKDCKKVEIVHVTTSSYNYINTILTFTNNITYLA